MPPDRLTRDAVADRALRLGDVEGLEAVTIRRLAQDLGVTPMALYWHFKSKEELLSGVVDHALTAIGSDRDPTEPWLAQLRAMVESMVTVLREHPCLPVLMQMVDKQASPSFIRASNDALALLTSAGFGVEEGYWVSSYLLHGCVNLVSAQPDCPATVPPERAGEWRRQKRLALEALPRDRYPMLVEFAQTYDRAPDVDLYYRFGVDLLMAGVAQMAERLPLQGEGVGSAG